MNEDRDDPIIDSLLEETLGGQAPPDLRARILQTWTAQGGAPTEGQAAGVPVAPGAAAPNPVAYPASPPVQGPPVQGPPVQRSAATEPPVQRAARSRKGILPRVSSRWMGLGVAAAVLLMTTALGIVWTKMYFDQRRDDIADRGPDGPAGVVDRRPGSGRTPRNPAGRLPERPRTHFASHVVAAPHAEVLSTVNRTIQLKWDEAGVTPAPPATDGEWVRRTHLRMLGRIPSVDQIEAFEKNDKAAPEKKAELLDEFLVADEFSEEHAQTWTTYWTNVLIGRTGGTQEDSPVSREGLQQYIRDSLLENKPFDLMAMELISATGTNDATDDDFNGATNFVLSGLENHGALAASKTSRIFMGKQLQCAQCHDHPFDNGVKQGQFWQLAAFFRQSTVEREDRLIRLADRDVQGPVESPHEVGIAYHGADGAKAVAFPVFVDGTELPRSGRLEEANRRTELARLVVESPDFARAIVNRTWAHILGRGFTWPIDDMGPHNPPSHPELLDYMSEQFAAHDYDFKSLVKWIALSDVYSLSSQISDGNRADDPEITKAPLFSRYYARPMQPEEVYDSLLALAGPQAAPQDFAAQEAAKLQWLGQFAVDLQTDDGTEFSIFDSTYTQKLEMLSGELIQTATDPENQDGILYRVIESRMPDEEKVEHLFLASLARRPTPEENAAAMQVVADRPDDTNAALEDLWWALLNSSEFLLDH